MKSVRDVMTTNVIQLSPANKIKTAIILMKGHNIGGLPVVEGGRIVGVIDYQDILGKDNDISVQSIMDKEFVTIPPQLSVMDAADLMSKINSSRLLVVDEGQLAGVVTHADLLPELGKSFDPITGLARADALRDWGITALKSGQEVTLLFLDLDQFGQFNKKYGHIIGDKVLQHVAAILESLVEEDRDMLCRYAGDEFVIVTTRNADEARELADLIYQQIENTPNHELPEPVTGSIGVYGGKRTREREDTHYNATLDNLINLASKACTEAKGQRVAFASLDGGVALETPSEEEVVDQLDEILPLEESKTIEEQIEQEEIEQFEVKPITMDLESESIDEQYDEDQLAEFSSGRLKLSKLNFSWDGNSMATAEVELADGVKSFRRSCSGFAVGPNALRLVADATAHAVCEFLPHPGFGVVAENLQVIHNNAESQTVLVTAILFTPQAQLRLSGSAIVRQDIYKAVSSALLDAINRQLSLLIA